MMAWSSESYTAVEGYHIVGGEASWSEQRQDKLWLQPGWEELTSTEQGATSRWHHAAPIVQLFPVLVPLSGTRPLTLGATGFSHRPGLDLNVSSLERLLWTQGPKQTLVSLITLLCFPHSTALGPGSKTLPYLHYHLSLDSFHGASCTTRSSVLPMYLALRRLQWVFLDEWTSGPEPSFNFWLLQKEEPVVAS